MSGIQSIGSGATLMILDPGTLSAVNSRILNTAKFARSLSSIKFRDDGCIFSLNSTKFRDQWHYLKE